MKKLIFISLLFICFNVQAQPAPGGSGSDSTLFFMIEKDSVMAVPNNIVYDNSFSNAYGSGGGSNTFSYTVGSGTDRILLIGTQVANSYNVSGITYNGVSMTQINTQSPNYGSPFGVVYLYYLINPSIGSNNVVISFGGTYCYSMIASYSGVNQSSPFDGNATTSVSSATSITGSITTTIANDWLVGFTIFDAGGLPAAGSATVIRQTQASYDVWMDSNGPRSIGSNSLIITSSTINMAMSLVALKSN